MSVLKRGVDNSAPGGTPFLGRCASKLEDNEDLFGDGIYAQAGCRSNVIQMVAEKSVNCSLVSLPRSRRSRLPLCGPLESLALMYILREQGALVAYDPEMMSKVCMASLFQWNNILNGIFVYSSRLASPTNVPPSAISITSTRS